jgi:hypothetical protein
MSQELFIYDVIQHGWEQEPKGYEANAKHVLSHLSKNLFKGFQNPEEVAAEIAPDSVMYALRLARWNCVEPIIGMDKLVVDNSHIGVVEKAAADFLDLPPHQVGYLAATVALARHVHGYDHDRMHESAIREQPQVVQEVGGLLLYSANLQADEMNFDLPQAFANRLGYLRDIFGIPEPEPGMYQLGFE